MHVHQHTPHTMSNTSFPLFDPSFTLESVQDSLLGLGRHMVRRKLCIPFYFYINCIYIILDILLNLIHSLGGQEGSILLTLNFATFYFFSSFPDTNAEPPARPCCPLQERDGCSSQNCSHRGHVAANERAECNSSWGGTCPCPLFCLL